MAIRTDTKDDLTAIEDLFLEEAKVVTLTGSAGREKSKLARDLVCFLEPAFSFDGQGGVHHILNPIDVADAQVKLAKALRLPKDAPTDEERIGAALAEAGHALLLFDGGEAPAEDIASLISGLSADAPNARFLVTSDGPLGVPGERAHRVVPPPPRVLVVGPGAAWFTLPDGRVIDLGQRMSARRILKHLALTRLVSAEEPSPLEELVQVGWPDDGATLSRQKAKNRVHVALHSLRRSGLEGLLMTVDAGYYLDAEVRLVAGDAESRVAA